MLDIALAVAVVVAMNVGAAVGGYYTALNHVDRLLDIEEGESSPSFPPGFEDGSAGNQLPKQALSPEEIDEVDDWEQWEE